MDSNCNLWRLLKLHEGRLAPAEADELRLLLVRQPMWKARWDELCKAVREFEIGSPGERKRERIDAEELAAFVEGQLQASRAQEIEELCWRDQQMLKEVISAYRFCGELSGGEPLAAEQDPLTQRLLDLYQQRVTGPPPILDPREPINGQAVAQVPITIDVGSSREKRPWQSRRDRLRFGWFAAAAAIVAIGLIGWWIRSQVGDRGVKPPVAGDQRTRDGSELAITNDAALPEPTRHQSDPVPEPDRPPSAPQIVRQEPESTSSEELSMEEIDRWIQADEPTPEPDKSTSTARLDLSWQRIEGVLAVLDPADNVWRGAECSLIREQGSTFKTLPGSWALAQQTQLGQLVLDADTAVAVTSGEQAGLVDVRLNYGRFAVNELPQTTRLRIRLGGVETAVRARAEGTSIAVDSRTGAPRITVAQGEVEINSVPIVHGRCIDLQRGQWTAPQPIRDNLRWSDRPLSVLRVSDQVRSSLLASEDLESDLLRMRDEAPDAIRATLLQLALAMAPDASLYEALTSSDAAVRRDASNWLFSIGLQDPRGRLGWRQLAVRSGDSAIARSAVRWSEKLRGRRALDRDEAASLISGLEHRDAAVRQLAAFALETQFGRRVIYDPLAAPALRQPATRQWSLLLRQAFGPPGR